MKKLFRCLIFLTLIIFMGFSTRPSSSLAAPQNIAFDPACLAICHTALSMFIALRSSEQKQCLLIRNALPDANDGALAVLIQLHCLNRSNLPAWAPVSDHEI